MASAEIAERVGRVLEKLESYAPGVHRLGAPARLLDAEIPDALAEVYRAFDGGELFHESLTLWPSARVQLREGMFQVGEADGDDLFVDVESGAVYRLEKDTGERLQEGTSFDRWLHGFVDAEALLYDREGEFREGVIDEAGELLPGAVIRRERAALKRDRKAAAPRWRLAAALGRTGEIEEARRELEEVVAEYPRFSWAWFDLARLSERLGAFSEAREEMVEAAAADESYEHAGYFWAHAARLAARAGDEQARARAAARALELEPDLARMQVDGARELLQAGEQKEARELIELAAALAPRDISVLDLQRRLARGGDEPEGDET